MSIEVYVAFALATSLMILLPGPSVMLTVSHSLTFGAPKALFTVTGAVAAIAVQFAVAIAGMTSFMLLMAEWFEVLRWAGVAYLIWLGVRQWRAPVAPDGAVEPRSAAASSLFLQGFMVTLGNPKSLIFLAAFLPQFLTPGAPLAPQVALMAPTFLLIGFIITALWALVAGHARRWFQGPRRLKLRNRVAGGLMIGAGAALAAVRRG